MSVKPLLPVITGPTASGKTACAVAFCRLADGEVVSADSMQVYRGMEILSAAPSEAEMGGIPHHMLGVFSPKDRCSAAEYRDGANAAIQNILARGKQPVLCGGTGLYIDAVTRPMKFSEKSDETLHAELLAMADEPGGRTRLHDLLQEVDPQSAARLHENDVRRVARAIEIYRLTGKTQTQHALEDAQREGDYQETIFTLDWPREVLYERISHRVDQMLEQGMIDEVRLLIHENRESPTAVQAIGYKEIAAALEGKMSMSDAVEAVKQATRNYAKRQMTWLRRDSRTIWISAENRTAEDLAGEIFSRWKDAIRARNC